MSTADEMTIGMLTGDEVITVEAGASLAEVAKVLTDAGVGAAVVGTADQALSIVSERDIVRCVAEGTDLDSTTAEMVSSRTLVWADISAPVFEVAEQMMQEWVRHVLVEEGGRLVGVVSSRDLLGVYAAQLRD
ncbi:MAG TPA: CBS domain-containing protein [Acidimicrobiales bacterium]|nr:CBS domain-containing protein [Acidimicrobiales bacterium]